MTDRRKAVLILSFFSIAADDAPPVLDTVHITGEKSERARVAGAAHAVEQETLERFGLWIEGLEP